MSVSLLHYIGSGLTNNPGSDESIDTARMQAKLCARADPVCFALIGRNWKISVPRAILHDWTPPTGLSAPVGSYVNLTPIPMTNSHFDRSFDGKIASKHNANTVALTLLLCHTASSSGRCCQSESEEDCYCQRSVPNDLHLRVSFVFSLLREIVMNAPSEHLFIYS